MSRYRRSWVCGGTYFFTVNILERDRTLLVDHIRVLRDAVKWVKAKRSFTIDAWVTLPDHIHAVWTLPEDDCDYSSRWREIKNEQDYRHHIGYTYFNPVKHGLVQSPIDWPYSTFHRDVKLGIYSSGWGGGPTPDSE